MTLTHVLGFMFTKTIVPEQVILIRKIKPPWQAGLFNGVGGAINLNEDPHLAMTREFLEETGVLTSRQEWSSFGEIVCPGYSPTSRFYVHLFKSFSDDAVASAKTQGMEVIHRVPVNHLHRVKGVSNLRWMVEMALDNNDGKPFFASINYPHFRPPSRAKPYS